MRRIKTGFLVLAAAVLLTFSASGAVLADTAPVLQEDLGYGVRYAFSDTHTDSGALKIHTVSFRPSEKKAELKLGLSHQSVSGVQHLLGMAEDEAAYKEWYGGTYTDKELHEKAVYGLPEFFREKIRGKKVIANPGCYTTAVPLALVPALENGLIESEGLIADCKSGVTGAGRKPTQSNHYPELNESFTAYKVAAHRHTPEIEQTLSKMTGCAAKITFVPHLLPINRGILATCYAKLKPGVTEDQLWDVYHARYDGEYFVRLLEKGQVANVKNVRYSNFCDVSLFMDSRTGTFIAISAIDNMVKGAAGQAIQNMNLSFGLEETTGLTMVPPAF